MTSFAAVLPRRLKVRDVAMLSGLAMVPPKARRPVPAVVPRKLTTLPASPRAASLLMASMPAERAMPLTKSLLALFRTSVPAPALVQTPPLTVPVTLPLRVRPWTT